MGRKGRRDEVDIRGACCACRREGLRLRNIVAMEFEHPEAGQTPARAVWGCFGCGLDSKGAMAVICDECLKQGNKVLDIVRINTSYPERLEITSEMRAKKFDHDMRFHPEAVEYARN